MTRSDQTPPPPTTGTSSRAGLPAERAFVIQLRADADLERGIVRGRLEHVLSGAAAQFESVEQLIGGMRDIVAPRSGTSKGNRSAKT
jgi:hypothetical protein